MADPLNHKANASTSGTTVRFPIRAMLILMAAMALCAAAGRAMLLFFPIFGWSFLVGLAIAAVCIGVVRIHSAFDASGPLAIAMTLVAGGVALSIALRTEGVLRDPLACFAGLTLGLPLFGFSGRIVRAFLKGYRTP